MRKGIVKTLGILGLAFLAAGPTLAPAHTGGGPAGGGHAGGGSHAGGSPGGGHFASANAYAGASSHAFGGQHGYSAAAGYGGAAHANGSYSRMASSRAGTLTSQGGSGYHGAYAGGGAYSGHGGYTGYHGGYYGGYHGGYHGYSSGAYWGGGWWHGGYWPHAYYGVGFAWFLPVLPLAYATYWYAGVPYYYANNVYYTWDPGYTGYVATDPPPITDQGGSAAPPASQSVPADGGYPDGNAQGAQIFMYPTNGQSPQQQATDRRECEQWAAQQAGSASNGADYQRAMTACVQGRGYSAG